MDYDIIVIGAGAAGVCAAIQAGRAGAKCALIEKNGVPGGTMTACGIAAPGLFAVNGKKIIGGIGLELVEKTLEIEGKNLPDFTEWNPTFWKNQVDINPIIFAAVCDEELLSADVRIYYHTMLGNLRQVDNLWRATLCGKEGLFDLTAKIIIDCTGDANATSIAGFEVVVPENVQPGTYSVLLSSKINHDLKTELDFESMQKIFEEENMQDKIFSADVGWGESYATLFLDRKGINANHVCNINAYSSENRTKAEIEGRRSVLRAYKFYKKFHYILDSHSTITH